MTQMPTREQENIRPLTRVLARLKAERERISVLISRSFVSVYVLRSCRIANGDLRWIFNVHRQEQDLVTLIARLDTENMFFQDFYVLPNLRNRTCWRMKPEDPGLRNGRRLWHIMLADENPQMGEGHASPSTVGWKPDQSLRISSKR